MIISKDIRYIGVDDRRIDLFEGQYSVPNGMCYNSYVILDEKIAVFDTVDVHFLNDWLSKLRLELDGRTPDYLIVSHMEPDHSANIVHFLEMYPSSTVVATAKAFAMMGQFFGNDYAERRVVVGEGDTLVLGSHTLTFLTAPMVHWPEVMVTYDSKDKVLFSADGFGKFGASDADEPWDDEAGRYYIGIVGKYGAQVQALLKKSSGLDIQTICPLHGPVLSDNLGHYIGLYDKWSSYAVEDEGVVIAYTSVYSNTKKAVEELAEKLRAQGCPKVIVTDLAREDMSNAVASAFRYGRLVLATTTYNADIFPFMRSFIEHLTERNYQNRTVAIIENGSWAPQAARVIKAMLEKCKNLNIVSPVVTVKSALNADSRKQLDELSAELCRDFGNQEQEKPQSEGKRGFICKICGYVYEGDELPEDFVCPLCKHGAADFEPIN